MVDGEFLDPTWWEGMEPHSSGQGMEEEEEEVVSVGPAEGDGATQMIWHPSQTPAFVQVWGGHQDDTCAWPYSEESGALVVGTLRHMSAFMLLCLHAYRWTLV